MSYTSEGHDRALFMDAFCSTSGPQDPLRQAFCLFFWLTSTLLHQYKFGNGIPGCTTLARPRGIFCSSSVPLHIFHWNHRARGKGPRPRSQGRFGIAGIRTRTGSDVCSVVTNCATPAPAFCLFTLACQALSWVGLSFSPAGCT